MRPTIPCLLIVFFVLSACGSQPARPAAAPTPAQATDASALLRFSSGKQCRAGGHEQYVQNTHDYKSILAVLRWPADELQISRAVYVAPQAIVRVDCTTGITIETAEFVDY